MSPIPRRLEGKVAIVTGSSHGIGRGIAVRLAQEGALVTVNHRKSDKDAEETARIIRQNGGKVLIVKADVSKWSEVDQMVAKTVSEFGRLDILCNNAGIMLDGSLLDTTEAMWDETMNINLKSFFLCAKRCVPEMLKQGRGKIINTASTDSFVAEPNVMAYCASKAGIAGLTYALALELAPKKINVNNVAPGAIRTPLIAEWLKSEALTKSMLDKTPIGRLGEPEDIAAAVAFLAADESEFINGATIVSDGGWLII